MALGSLGHRDNLSRVLMGKPMSSHRCAIAALVLLIIAFRVPEATPATRATPESYRFDHLEQGILLVMTKNDQLETEIQQLRDENDKRKQDIEFLQNRVNDLEAEIITMPRR